MISGNTLEFFVRMRDMFSSPLAKLATNSHNTFRGMQSDVDTLNGKIKGLDSSYRPSRESAATLALKHGAMETVATTMRVSPFEICGYSHFERVQFFLHSIAEGEAQEALLRRPLEPVLLPLGQHRGFSR